MTDFLQGLFEKYNYEKWSLIFVEIGLFAPTMIFALIFLTSWGVDVGIVRQFVFSSEIGPIGDFVAGITVPFLTLAAFILLYGSYKLQKEEMQASSNALQEQADSLQKQLQIMQSQNQQKIFFDLLNLLERNRNIDFNMEVLGSKEKNYFKAIQEIFSYYDIDFERSNCVEELEKKNDISYDLVVTSIAEDTYRYINALTGVLKFMDSFDIELENRTIFELAFQAGITLPEKRFLIMYANSNFPFKDSYIITRLEQLKVLSWNTENTEYGRLK